MGILAAEARLAAEITPPSIFDVPPLETGGTASRQGFAFQDHVIAGFCIDLLLAPELEEVWCETQDDCTLLWRRQGEVLCEYVQSKNTKPDQLWSVALLCNRDSKGIGHSILEKSLAYDRCHEACKFRLVTSCDVVSDLRPLTYPLEAPGRAPAEADMISLHAAVKGRVGTYRSKNGNDCQFWLDNALWEIRHSDEDVKNANIVKLIRALNGMDIFLAVDQVEELYSRIMKKVWDASLLDAMVKPLGKRLKKADFHTWLIAAVSEINMPSAGADGLMRGKLEKASLAPDIVRSALEQRRYYREEVLSPKYLPLDHRRLIEREVSAILQRLKSRLDKGEIADNGIAFHDLCLDALEELRKTLPISPQPPLSVFQGCMYSMAGRCVHRFRRATA